jgi:hypothetical protein
VILTGRTRYDSDKWLLACETVKKKYTGCIFNFEALFRLTDFYLNIYRIIQLDGKAPQIPTCLWWKIVLAS